MGDDSEWMKLPTDEKCQHKAWKARVAGYEEAMKVFTTAGDEKSPEFPKYLGLVKKFVVDNNAVAQEKGLEATLAYVENAAVAGKAASEVCGGIVNKCLNQRAKTRDLGMAILMMYIEIEKHEIVQEELMKGLTNKQPKIVSACVVALREALRDFGTKVISIKPILKQLQTLLEDRDKTVRDETKMLAVEIYRWIGPALKPQLTNLKPVQITELEGEFEKLPPSKPIQTRFLKSQQDLKAKLMEQQALAGDQLDGQAAGGEQLQATETIDPYDLLDPVDILSKLPSDYYEKIEAKKWQDRREVLEAVQKLAESPKLEQGDYSELVRSLKKVVAKDSNVLLVGIAVKCIALLAAGLRKKFSTHAVGCIEVLLDKFREKKAAVVQALREAVDAVFITTTLEPISEACVASLDHKTPSVKAETALFLARSFAKCTQATLPKKLLKLFVGALLKTVDDAAGEVREASFEALGTAMKVVTEKAIAPFLADVDKIKMEKIKECCDKASVVGKTSAPPASADAGQPGKSAAVNSAKPPSTASASSGPKINPPGGPPRPGSSSSSAAAGKKGDAHGSGVTGSTGSGVIGGGAAGAKKKPAAGGGKGKKAEAKEEALERELSDEAVEEKMVQLVSEETVKALADANWKERLSAVEKITNAVKTMPRDDIPCQAIVRTINKKPGLKDNNFQVLKVKVDLIGHLAQNSSFSKRSAEYCLTDLVDKIGDAKNGSSVQEALSCIAEAVTLDYVALQVLQLTFEQKNPKNQSETFVWLAGAVKQFGFKQLDVLLTEFVNGFTENRLTVKPIVEAVNKALAATNPGVRTAAVTLLGVMYMYMGPSLRVLFESEKPALLQTIDAEFDKVKGEKPPPPTRGLRKLGSAPGDDDQDDVDDAGGDGQSAGGTESANVADLIPRNDISDRFREELLAEIGDKNWKVRKEGLDKVVAILNEAKFITPNIGQLPEVLKPRLADSNKILAGVALSICQTLATSMGPPIKNHVRTLGSGIISNFGDSKPAMRQNAVQCLNAWVEHTGLAIFVEAEIFAEALKTENPFLRAELLGWLAEKLPSSKKLPPEFGECVPHLFACLEDRNADVRKKAHDAVLPFMIQTGYDAMVRHAAKVKPASKDAVMKVLEQTRPNLPQKQAASKPAGAVISSKQTAPVEKVPDVVDDTPAPTQATTVKPGAGKTGGKPASGAGGGAGNAAGAKKGTAGASQASGSGGSAAGGAAGKKKGQEEEDTSPPLKPSNGKEQRFKDEKNLKVLKWNFSAPRPEFIEQLRQQMEPTFNRTLLDQLFHVDFKFHIKALDTMSKVCNDGSAGVEATLTNIDLILKWHTLRFFDTNTTVLMKQLEFLQLIFNTAINEGYHLHEFEAVSFIPYLVNKVGDPKDNIRKDVRVIFQLLCKVHPPQKMFVYVTDGLKSKNAKQRTECLEELGLLIDSYGLQVCQPSPAVALKQIAQQIGDRDNSVRSAALNTIVIAYSFLGEALYKHIGSLNDKDQSMLEERIKRSSKSVRASIPPPSLSAPVPVQSARLSPDEKQSKMPSSRTMQPPAQSRTETRLPSNAAVTGPFRLDVDESYTPFSATMPQLIDVSADLNEILNEPVKMPTISSRKNPIKLLHTSTDARTAVDLVISQIASTDIQTSLQALAQIDEVLLDEEKSEAIASHVDQLLITCTLQLRMTYSKHRNLHADNVDAVHDVLKMYKCLLATILSISSSLYILNDWQLCHRKTLVREATRDVLKDLIYHLITMLLDNRLNELEDGPQIARSVNVTVVRIVEKAEVTNMMSALIKLLQESLGSEMCSSHFIELVMKCIWKMVRMLPQMINELNIDRILVDLHVFLVAFPSNTWKSRPSDMPLRTIKTILHTFVKIKGNKILSHMTLIDRTDQQPSEVESYLRKLLRTAGGGGGSTGNDVGVDLVPAANAHNDHLNGSSTEMQTSALSQSISGQESEQRRTQRKLSRSIHDTLAEIFKKIGSKENTREGLNDLYDFKLQHPDADIDPFLKRSTPFFQDYIARGLKSVEHERLEKQKNPPASLTTAQEPTVSQPSSTVSSSGTSTNNSNSAASLTAADYLERLRVLRARCGLDNNADSKMQPSSNDVSGGDTDNSSIKVRGSTTRTLDNALAGVTSMSINANPEPALSMPQTTVSASVTDIDELKKRLEKIKNNVK